MTKNETTNEKSNINVGDFGFGRYSCAMSELYRDCKHYFGVTDEQADKFARAVGSDYGRLASSGEAKVSVGKASKDGKVTLREIAVVKGVTTTNSLTIARLIQLLNDCAKQGMLYSDTTIALRPDLHDWLTGTSKNSAAASPTEV